MKPRWSLMLDLLLFLSFADKVHVPFSGSRSMPTGGFSADSFVVVLEVLAVFPPLLFSVPTPALPLELLLELLVLVLLAMLLSLLSSLSLLESSMLPLGAETAEWVGGNVNSEDIKM